MTNMTLLLRQLLDRTDRTCDIQLACLAQSRAGHVCFYGQIGLANNIYAF
jgi:hypothetical protein